MKKIFKLIGLLIVVCSYTKGFAQVIIAKVETDNQNGLEVSLKPLLQANYSVNFQNMKAKDGFAPHLIEAPQENMVSGYFSMKQSTIGLEIKQTGKNKSDENRFSAYLEIDFYGKNGTTAPRFKHGFVRWNRWTIGQTSSNFSDNEIYPDIFDFNGPGGLLYSRRIQLSRYIPLSKKEVISLSLEDPNTPSITLPDNSLNWKKKAVIPSISVMYRYGDDENYLKAGAILLPISYSSKQSTEESYKTSTIAGWGGMISGKFRHDAANIFSFESSFGKGISTYNADLNGEHYDALPDPAHQNLLETLQLFNIVGIYEHWWNSKWSSVAFASYSKIGNKDFIQGDMTKSFHHMSTNLIFHPHKKFKIGIEANYGTKENFENRKVHAWKFQTSASWRL